MPVAADFRENTMAPPSDPKPESDSPVAMIGRKLDHYEIQEKLGEGGMGQVYLARDGKLSRQVAVKVLRDQFSSDARSLRRFEQEARSVSVLNHPNIVTIHDIGNVQGTPFIVMELVEGESLRTLLKEGPLPMRTTLKLAAQAAEGLAKAHGVGVVHRDLKPENLMVTADGFLKILDFGLAKLHSPSTMSDSMQTMEATHPGTVVGTLAYMSPEQASGRDVDFRSDQFSLGLITYEMAAGKNPFKKNTGAQTLAAIIDETPEPLRSLNPAVPPAFQEIVERCLAKSPDARFHTTDELAAALEELRGRMTQSSAEAARIPAAPSWKGWLAIAAALLAAVVLGSYAIDLQRSPSNTASSGAAAADPEGEGILVADFENQTGEDIFDESLQRAFSIGIGQSQSIRILPPSRVEGALKRMRMGGRERLDESTAREVARREGARLMVLPAIAGVGGSYVLTASIQDPVTGASLSSHAIRAQSRGQVLDALDRLVIEVRGALGETESAIALTSRPLVEVTTGSLEALSEYSLGVESYKAWRLQEAKLHYENALHLDPDFTAARASLGMLLVETFRDDSGKELIERAVAELDGLTERERLGILAFHAQAVEKDTEQAIAYLRARTSSFPDDVAAHHSLGWYRYQQRRFEDAAASFQQAIRADPYFMMSYNVLGWIYLYEWGDMAAAIDLAHRQIAHDDTNPQAFDNLGAAYLGRGDWNRAEEALRRAIEIDPAFAFSLSRLGHLYRMVGRYSEAIESFEKILARPRREPENAELLELLTTTHYDIGVVHELNGERDRARSHFEEYRKQLLARLEGSDRGARAIEAAILSSRLGEGERAAELARDALEGSDLQFESARWLAIEGRIDEALERLTRAIDAGYRNFIWIRIHPDFQGLYDDPRFQALLERGFKT
jgi:serine/threonine protein kinase/tetratricopeptide (TPR) repeat protein